MFDQTETPKKKNTTTGLDLIPLCPLTNELDVGLRGADSQNRITTPPARY